MGNTRLKEGLQRLVGQLKSNEKQKIQAIATLETVGLEKIDLLAEINHLKTMNDDLKTMNDHLSKLSKVNTCVVERHSSDQECFNAMKEEYNQKLKTVLNKHDEYVKHATSEITKRNKLITVLLSESSNSTSGGKR